MVPLGFVSMSDKDPDPTASTAAFKAFAEEPVAEQHKSKAGLVITVVALVAAVVAGAVAYLILG